jgi:hypothetical protein
MALVLALGEEAAPSIAEVVRDCLAHRALPAVEADGWERSQAATLILVVDCEADGEPCAPAAKFLRTLRRSECFANFSESIGRRVAVLALARSVCSNSSAMLGSTEKFSGGARVLKTLLASGCTRLVPLGMAEVELQPVEACVIPWARSVCTAVDGADMDALDDITTAKPGDSSIRSRRDVPLAAETEPTDGRGAGAHALSGLVAAAVLGVLAVALVGAWRRTR